MSTILKAFHELEKRGTPVTRPETSWDERGARWWWFVAALVLVLAGGTAGLVVVFLGHNPPPTMSGARSVPVARPHVGQAPPAPVAPAAVAPAPEASHAAQLPAVPRDEPPRARVDKGKVAVAPAVPAPAVAAPPVHKRVAHRPKPRPKAPPAEAAAASAPIAGEPGVEVKSFAYSPDPAKRVVTLRLEGTRVVKLREGESAGGFEVQLIAPDAVYLRHGASVFAVGMP